MRQAYSDRMTMPEAIEAVGRMIAAYPNGGGNAGKSYIGTIAAMLTQYPKSIAVQCANPLSGVARETRFLPTVADVVAWCEPRADAVRQRVDRELRIARQLEERDAMEQRAPAPRTNPLPADCRANVFVPVACREHAALLERAKTADSRDYHARETGIWVPLTWLTMAPRAPTWRKFTDEELRRIYAPAPPVHVSRKTSDGEVAF